MREIFLNITNEYIKQSDRFAGVQGAANATALILSFDESWDGFAKHLTWFNAEGQNPVYLLLTMDKALDQSFRKYRVLIPKEALELGGNCILVIEGYKDSAVAKSITAEFEVAPSPDTSKALTGQEPSPTLAQQLQEEIEDIKDGIVAAVSNSAEAQKTAKTAEENSKKLPYPADEVWHIWNGTEYVATNEPSRGEKGNKGDKGDRGEKGDQGYTPLRGVDYWTNADKAEIVNETAESIPTASADTRGVIKVGNGLKMDGETLNFDNGKWECIEKICFGYELLTEKPDDWDTAKTTKYYYAATENSCNMYNCHSWDTWMLNRYWKYTGEYDTQIQRIDRSKEPDGTPYNFKCVAAIGHLFNTVKAGLWCFSAYLRDSDLQNQSRGINGVIKFDTQTNGYPYHMAYKIEQNYGVYELTGWHGSQGNFTARTGVSNASPDSLMRPVSDGNIRGIGFYIYSAKEYYSEGDYIEIWGVRADG